MGSHCMELFSCIERIRHHIATVQLVDQIHLPIRQSIKPPQWLGAHLHLYLKIL